MRIDGKITLFHESPDDDVKVFGNQTFEIRDELRTARLGRDGRLTVADHPKRVIWYGGNPEVLMNIAHIQIVSRGRVILDEDLSNDGQPKAVAGGVSFEVSRKE
jgi:hypothetical protein